MKVIVCGAGQVGSNIARYLAGEGGDVTVIDTSQDLITKIVESLDVNGVVGFASHPDVLERAGARDADMIIAVTYADEVNMVACQVAHSLFDVPTKIARIRNQSYLDSVWASLFSRDHLPIDAIISPEVEVARAIERRLHVPGSLDVQLLAREKVLLVGVKCHEDTPVINTPLRELTELFPDLHITVAAISREGQGFVPSADEVMMANDEVYLIIDADHLPRVMAVFGQEEREARRILIVGGGNIGLTLAKMLEAWPGGLNLKLIEVNKDRAEAIAQQLERTTVIRGDALDTDLLDEVGAGHVETVIAVSNDDEVNILASLLAKRQGARRAVTLINKSSYGPLVGPLGVDMLVSPRSITVSTILQHVRRGRIRSVHSVADGFGEVIEAEALETSGLVGKPLRELDLPDGVLIGALVRGEEVIIARPDTVIQANDLVILFAETKAVKRVERLFSVRLEFF